MKKTILFFAAILFAATIIAQNNTSVLAKNNLIDNTLLQDAVVDTSWKSGGVFGLNFGQTSFKNWAAGGVNSIAVGGLLNHFRNYKKGDWSWDNNLDLAYGIIWQGENDGIKSDDRIDFSSKVGKNIKNTPWNWAALVNFRTQFADGYDNPFAADSVRNTISTFMAPAYVLASLGIDYKPSDAFSAYISPVTGKFTIVNDQDLADAGAFGVEEATFDTFGNMVTAGENFRAELGAYAKAQYTTKIVENVGLMTKLDLFMNYQEPTHIDVGWEALLNMKVNQYINATIGAQVLYDHDIDIARGEGANLQVGPTTQFKQTLNVGFAYTF